MAVQSGKDLLLKVDLTGDGQFETVAGLRATRISFNAETVDVTSLDSAGGWRELLALPERWPIPSLPVSGRDLLAAGMNPGPEIGVTLRKLEDWWVASDFTPGRDDLLKRLT